MLVSFLKVLNNRPVRISAHSKFKKLNKRPGWLIGHLRYTFTNIIKFRVSTFHWK